MSSDDPGRVLGDLRVLWSQQSQPVGAPPDTEVPEKAGGGGDQTVSTSCALRFTLEATWQYSLVAHVNKTFMVNGKELFPVRLLQLI